MALGQPLAPLGLQVGLGARHKEAACLVQPMQALEIDIPSIHDVEGARLGDQQIEHIHVVQFAIADMDEGRDVAAQVQQHMQLDGCLGRANGPSSLLKFYIYLGKDLF